MQIDVQSILNEIRQEPFVQHRRAFDRERHSFEREINQDARFTARCLRPMNMNPCRLRREFLEGHLPGELQGCAIKHELDTPGSRAFCDSTLLVGRQICVERNRRACGVIGIGREISAREIGSSWLSANNREG